jgi:TrmH family RNA methyltransferase
VTPQYNFPTLSQKIRKLFRDLQRSGHREEHRLFVAEGLHCCQDLAHAHVIPRFVVVRGDASAQALRLAEHMADLGAEVYIGTAKDVDHITDAISPQDILAAFPYLHDRAMGDKVIMLDAVADPGNVGTIIRTAAWFGCTDVVLGHGTADVYNAKVVRATAGALVRMNIHRRVDLPSVLAQVKDGPIIAAVAHGGIAPDQCRGLRRFTLIIGSEAHGVDDELLHSCTHRVTIPGGNGVESLNAAIASALLCYELTRP